MEDKKAVYSDLMVDMDMDIAVAAEVVVVAVAAVVDMENIAASYLLLAIGMMTMMSLCFESHVLFGYY
jgi:acyl CoA:acetate/3-ketoacid CoA transferase alpha subunit